MATKKEKDDIEQLKDDVKSIGSQVQTLAFDSDKVVKPAIKRIEEVLARDLYVPKADYNKYSDRTDVRLDDLEKATRNTPLVEKVMFGLVGVVLMAVAGAVVALVVVKP